MMTFFKMFFKKTSLNKINGLWTFKPHVFENRGGISKLKNNKDFISLVKFFFSLLKTFSAKRKIEKQASDK